MGISDDNRQQLLLSNNIINKPSAHHVVQSKCHPGTSNGLDQGVHISSQQDGRCSQQIITRHSIDNTADDTETSEQLAMQSSTAGSADAAEILVDERFSSVVANDEKTSGLTDQSSSRNTDGQTSNGSDMGLATVVDSFRNENSVNDAANMDQETVPTGNITSVHGDTCADDMSVDWHDKGNISDSSQWLVVAYVLMSVYSHFDSICCCLALTHCGLAMPYQELISSTWVKPNPRYNSEYKSTFCNLWNNSSCLELKFYHIIEAYSITRDIEEKEADGQIITHVYIFVSGCEISMRNPS